MRTVSILAAFVVCCLVAAPAAQAVIESWNCDGDGDGVLVMNPVNETNPPDLGGYYRMDISGSHGWTAEYGNVGNLEGDVIAPADPTMWLVQTLDNDTNFDWTDYHIEIGMDKSFTLNVNSMIVPAGWTWVITQPVGGQPLPSHINPGTGWVGSIDYYYNGSGSEILVGGTGTFGLIATFDGTVAFCTEQYPTPEPTALAMLALGAPLFIGRRRRA